MVQAPWFLLAAWFVPGWVLAGAATAVRTLESELLAVGHGLAVVIQVPDGKTYLYDCGRMGDPSVGRRIVAPALWSRGINRIDTIFLSHADHDHYDGLPDLLDRFAIGEVRVPPGFGGRANPEAVALLQRVRSRAIPVRSIAAREAWKAGGGQFTVLHPAVDWNLDAPDNARSLVLDIAFAGQHFLLTGDLEQAGLTALIGQPALDPPPDVMLAPHHGGKSANPSALYEWAKPRAVVVSQRALPPQSSDALAEIEKRRVPLYRTWKNGAIRLRFTRLGIAVRGFLDQDDDSGPRMVFAGVLGTLSNFASAPASRLLFGLAGIAIGLIVCAALAVIEIAAWSLVAPSRNRARPGAVGAVLCEPEGPVEPIEIRAVDGVRLVGRFMAARGPIPTGRIVLLLHGFAETGRELERQRMAALSADGWNVAALDSRGYGQSGGVYATFGGHEAGDVRAWLDQLAERVTDVGRPEFRPALWGRSMGAQIAMRAAAEDGRIAALVLESPLVDLAAAAAAALRRRRFPLSGVLSRLILRRARKLAGMPLDRPRPIDLASHVTCPVLILHGGSDALVSADEVHRLIAAFPGAPQYRDVPGAGHSDVVATGGEPLLREVAAFLGEAGVQNEAIEFTKPEGMRPDPASLDTQA
jgi:competence protein ComEC